MRRFAAIALALCAPPGFASCETGGAFTAGASRIDVAFEAGHYALSRGETCAWLARAARAVTRYYGTFPVPAVMIRIRPVAGTQVSNGTTFSHRHDGGPLVVVDLGTQATAATLAGDWVMTHELTHLATPEVPDASHWLEEGIATYVEPIARVQAGELTPARIWGDLRADLWKGTPAEGDAGLDHTPTWGRTYWGGALFCLLADVEIRQRTGNRLGLQDALRGVIAAGGNIEQSWSVAKIMATGDAATGVPVLAGLYAAMKDQPGPGTGELDALFARLGVIAVGARDVRFDERAPLAAIRRAITAPRN